MHFIKSIFDSNQQDYHLWHKQEDLPEFDPNVRDSLSATAYKPKSQASKLVKRHFFTKNKFLCYKRKISNQEYSGVMDLTWVRAEFKEEEDEVLRDKCPYYVMLIKEEKYTTVHFKSLKEVQDWRQALAEIVIMTDFHGRYSAVEMIGEGNYAKVGILIYLKFYFYFTK